MKIILINGTAGAGKTYTLVNKFIKDEEINKCYCAFTVSASDEAMQRMYNIEVTNSFTHSVNKNIAYCGTIHSIAFSIYTKQNNIQIENTNIEYEFLKIRKQICRDENVIFSLDTPDAEGNQFFLRIDALRNQLKDPFENIDSLIHGLINISYSKAKRMIEKYFKMLKLTKLKTDFTGLLEWCIFNKYFVSDYFKVVYVDEFQDTTRLQDTFIGKPNVLVLAGDIEQTLYFPFGVTIEDKYKIYDEAEKIFLNKSRRVPKNIVAKANIVRMLMPYKADYQMQTEVQGGEITKCSSFDQFLQYLVNCGGMCLCYRNTDVWLIFKELINRYNVVPRLLSPRKFSFRMSVIKDYILLKTGGFFKKQDYTELTDKEQKIIQKYGVKNLTLTFNNLKVLIKNKFFTLFKEFDINPCVLDLNYNMQYRDDIIVDTIHEAKGREAENVFIFDYYPRLKFETVNGKGIKYLPYIQFVAITRTKKRLFIFTPSRNSVSSPWQYFFGWD